MKFLIKDFFSKCDHLLKKSLMENFIFCAVKELKNVSNNVENDIWKRWCLGLTVLPLYRNHTIDLH